MSVFPTTFLHLFVLSWLAQFVRLDSHTNSLSPSSVLIKFHLHSHHHCAMPRQTLIRPPGGGAHFTHVVRPVRARHRPIFEYYPKRFPFWTKTSWLSVQSPVIRQREKPLCYLSSCKKLPWTSHRIEIIVPVSTIPSEDCLAMERPRRLSGREKALHANFCKARKARLRNLKGFHHDFVEFGEEVAANSTAHVSGT